MSNSVVRVTDSTLNDRLLLLVGEDGTVTPSKDIVDAYLRDKTCATNLQVMHIDRSDEQTIEVAVNDMLYLPEAESDGIEEANFDEIAYNLYNIKLDHDYTTLSEPVEEVDELAKTLSILDGDTDDADLKINKLPETPRTQKTVLKESVITSVNSSKTKVVHPPTKLIKNSQKKVKLKEKDDKGIHAEEEEHTEFESDETKLKTPKRIYKPEIKSKDGFKTVKPTEPIKTEKPQSQVVTPETKPQDKKQIKKERKPSKSTLDDFALFSTPDIIRRVGGKEPAGLTSPTSTTSPESKPARIEVRSKSVTESPLSSKKQERLSLDGKVNEKPVPKSDSKTKDNRSHLDAKIKRSVEHSVRKSIDLTKSNVDVSNDMEQPADDMSFISSESENKAYPGNLSMETSDLSSNEQNMNLDANSLDLDPALLENINNDLISEDILYQVAQSLVSNTELQNAIDKSLNEENLDLSSVQDNLVPRTSVAEPTLSEQVSSSQMSQKGTQIVRPDGRIVVIPPIERPTTRSRNKRSSEDRSLLKFTRKPLDDEHVSGNELDSSGDEEEESEDDPNKLWCICNQPHNNRFMICCDTCEEWYHGKCVNITKAMGQQMESEGREWICLFCKDPLLKRPQAAAKRIRKASRNSRQSTDSNSSTKMTEVKASSVPCVVCHKPSRSNSIFCSEACILIHAQGVERVSDAKVVVFERATGNMLTGNRAPSAANLEQWLKNHPGYEVVRSAGKIVTTKTHNVQQSKLKLIKPLSTDPDNINKVKTSVGMPKNLKNPSPQLVKPAQKMGNIQGVKVINKQVAISQGKEKSLQSSNKEAHTPPKMKVIHSTIKSTPSPLMKEKITPTKVQKPRQVEQPAGTPHTKQENIRENVQKTIFEQLTNRLKAVDDLKLSEEELKSISTEIESQLYKCFGDTGQKYRNKYRSLIFNIKDIKNQTLWRRICEKSINPYQLVRLSPDDLASQELALWREREAKHQLDMIKKSELELLKCNRQYVLKTHKGEQILEDNRPTDHIDNTEVITSLTDGSNEKLDVKKDSSKDGEKKKSKHSHKDRDRKSSKDKSDSKSHHSHRSSSRDHDRSRKRSRSRDKNSKHGERRRSRSQGRERHRKSSHKSSKYKKDLHRGSSTEKLDKKSKEILEQLVENKIVPSLEDRLWKHVPQEDILPAPSIESDSDNEPTSTVTIPTPPRNSESDEFLTNPVLTESQNDKPLEKDRVDSDTKVGSQTSRAKSEEIWRGVINMVDVAQISITAHEVSGDCNGLSTELSPNLDIVGRISPDTVWDYIGKMKCSNSKIISIVRLNAINVEEKMPYLALYSYLSSRNRLGVVKSTNKAVKDFYILPLASQKPIPQALLPLNGPGFEEARPALLLGIIVRDKRKRPYIESISPVVTSVKKTKIDLPLAQATPPARSYTPPPVKDPRLTLPLPPTVVDQDGDEPYSPEDSDPDSMAPSTTESVSNKSTNFLEAEVGSSQTFQPFANKFDDIPGLDSAALPSNTQEIQRQMEKLNKEIEMQKSEINSISQNIATASTEIGTSALANIALPSNLQQILDSIKTIDTKPQTGGAPQESSELTIPLMLPTSFSRQSSSTSSNTIPLNLPSKKKSTTDLDKSSSVLSSLSEEDLIRKAEEMLGDTKTHKEVGTASESLHSDHSFSQPKVPRLELKQPAIPGLEDEEM